MKAHSDYLLNRKNLFLILFFPALMVGQGCLNTHEDTPTQTKESAPAGFSAGACVDVEGLVLGDVIPYSNVSLHEVPMLDYSVVMHVIKTTPPTRSSTVNESKGFIFKCLYPGK